MTPPPPPSRPADPPRPARTRTRRSPAAAARRRTVRRILLGALLLGSALTLVAAIPSGAQRPDPPGPVVQASARTVESACPQREFIDALQCWGERAGDGRRLVVTLTAPQELPADAGPDTVKNAVDRLRDRLIVIVPDTVRTGSGGTFLMALASQRVVGPASTVSALAERTREQLVQHSGCPPDKFCDALRREPMSGKDLVANGLAQDGAATLFTAGPPENAPLPQTTGREDGTEVTGAGDVGKGSGGESDLPLVLFVIALLVCGVITMGVLVRRTHATVGPPSATPPAAGGGPPRHRGGGRSRPPTQQPVPATPAGAATTTDPGPRPPDGRDHRTAALVAGPRRRPSVHRTRRRPTVTVRTALGPQGYVSVNGLLYRATWGGPGEPPAPGQRVDLVHGDGTGEPTVYALGTADDRAPGDETAPIG